MFAKKMAITLGVSLVSLGAVAQNFSINAEFRPRTEYRNGFQRPLTTAQNPNMIVLNRTRLGFDYAGERLKSRLTLQDSRIWGATELKPNVPLKIFEAWAEVGFTDKLSLTVGRQALAYDYNRIFATSNWTVDGQSHDLALLRLNDADLGLKADLGLAINNPSDALSEPVYNHNTKLYRHLEFLRVESRFADMLKASAIMLSEGFQQVDTVPAVTGHIGRYTTGINLELIDQDLPVTATLTGYYQFGQNPTTQKKLSAYLLAARVGFKPAEKWGLYVGSDIYSGTAEGAEVNNTWNKLYGSNHSYNGSIEYWRTLPTEGLIDIFGGLTTKLAKLTGEACYHIFLSQKPMYSAGCTGSDLGSEIDLTLKYKLSPFVNFEGGWCTYFCSSNTELLKNVANQDLRFAHWAYLTLNVKLELFSHKAQKVAE